YNTLKLKAPVTKDVLRARFLELMKDYHPDTLGQATQAQRSLIEEKTKEINRAYEILQRIISVQEAATVFSKIVSTIVAFTPSFKWPNESGYQAELLSYLKQSFPDAVVEPQSGASRPDIAIQDIAIEVKGPTDNQALNTVTTKCLKYCHHYSKLIIVLFQPMFSERNYEEIQRGVNQYFPNVRIIRKG
ncbi:MAG: J domain-containing protein, partial [Rhabdochlamydiaceae bacterium]